MQEGWSDGGEKIANSTTKALIGSEKYYCGILTSWTCSGWYMEKAIIKYRRGTSYVRRVSPPDKEEGEVQVFARRGSVYNNVLAPTTSAHPPAPQARISCYTVACKHTQRDGHNHL